MTSAASAGVTAMPWHLEADHLRIRKLCVGSLENNVYVVACTRTSRAVIVDAAAEPDRIVAATTDVEPIAILTTHGHHDHVGAVGVVTGALGIPFLMHPADTALAGRTPDRDLVAGGLAVGDLQIEIRHTPGHTPGSCTFIVDGVALTGDTLFPGGPGATRGTFDQIMASIEERIFDLDPSTLVMPGHGLDTTIAAEAPSLASWRRRGW